MFSLQQNLEIHKKMGMSDEQLEAYEKQEREVFDHHKISLGKVCGNLSEGSGELKR